MHLNHKEVDTVKKILALYVPEFEVWAFGSRVHGRHLKKFSDLDLAVISEKPPPNSKIENLREAFTHSDLPFRVDVVDWSSTDESFRKIIRQDHEVIQSRPGSSTS